MTGRYRRWTRWVTFDEDGFTLQPPSGELDEVTVIWVNLSPAGSVTGAGFQPDVLGGRDIE